MSEKFNTYKWVESKTLNNLQKSINVKLWLTEKLEKTDFKKKLLLIENKITTRDSIFNIPWIENKENIQLFAWMNEVSNYCENNFWDFKNICEENLDLNFA